MNACARRMESGKNRDYHHEFPRPDLASHAARPERILEGATKRWSCYAAGDPTTPPGRDLLIRLSLQRQWLHRAAVVPFRSRDVGRFFRASRINVRVCRLCCSPCTTLSPTGMHGAICCAIHDVPQVEIAARATTSPLVAYEVADGNRSM